MNSATLEALACKALNGRLVDSGLVARAQRGTTTLMGAPFIGPRCPTATVTVVVGRGRGRRFREVEMNAATGSIIAVRAAGVSC